MSASYVSFVLLPQLLFWAAASAAQEDHSQHSSPLDEHREHVSPAIGHDNHSAHPASERATESERAHVPPDPPTLVLGDMSNERMIELMQMEDDAAYWMVQLDELEAFRVDGDEAFGWDANAWFGTDYHKLWLKADGERIDSEATGQVELLWDRIVSPWWSLQAGVRHDVLDGPSRTWAAIGVQGVAPYFIETEAMLYLAEDGRTAARFEAETDWLLTQRLILQPSLEVHAFGRDDRANDIGSGVADLELGLRLRYEIVRELAPYLGVKWQRELGETAEFSKRAGRDPSEVMFIAGVRAWF